MVRIKLATALYELGWIHGDQSPQYGKKSTQEKWHKGPNKILITQDGRVVFRGNGNGTNLLDPDVIDVIQAVWSGCGIWPQAAEATRRDQNGAAE